MGNLTINFEITQQHRQEGFDLACKMLRLGSDPRGVVRLVADKAFPFVHPQLKEGVHNRWSRRYDDEYEELLEEGEALKLKEAVRVVLKAIKHVSEAGNGAGA